MSDLDALHPNIEQLQAYRSGTLGLAESAEIEHHAAACETCRRAMETSPETLTETRQGPAIDDGPEATAAFSSSGRMSSTARASDRPDDSKVPEDLSDHPRYHILELIGTGGMGAVFKAEHRLMRRLVALKVIKSNLMDRPIMVERFRREVHAAAHLDHPNIVSAHDAERSGSTHFLGRVLRQLLRLFVNEDSAIVNEVSALLNQGFSRTSGLSVDFAR